MPDITGTKNYENYLLAKVTFSADRSTANGQEWGRQLATCIEQADGNARLLR